MAYYINPKEQKKKLEKLQEQNKPKDNRMQKFFFQILGCVIVLVVFLIIYIVKEL